MPEITVTGKGVIIEDEDWWPSALDDTYFGTVSPGKLVTRTFKVWNTGTATLTLETPVLPFGWAFRAGTDALVSSLAPDAWDTFSVAFSASAPGAYRGNISIVNNDSDENPYVFAIMAIVGVPEIHVSGKGLTIDDGDTTPRTADDTNFGTIPLNTIASRTFLVTNIGEDTLYLGTTPSLPTGFRLGSNRLVASLAPGAWDTFVVEFPSVTAGTYGGDVVIYNNDADESPYNFTIMAIAGSPEINVSGKGLTILDGDTTPSTLDDTNFGTVPLNTIASRTFTVANTGSDTLWLGTTPSLPAGFRLGADRLVASLAPNTSDTFVVEFVSVTAATYGGDVVIYNNDANESPYNFRIMAIAGSPEIDVSGNGRSIADEDTDPWTGDHTDFGTVPLNTWVYRTFTVTNTGSDTLWLGTPSVIGGVFRLASNSLGPSLAPNTSGTFVVSFLASVANTYVGQISLFNSDSNESPYNFSVLAKAGVPEIDIKGNGRSIANGDYDPSILDDTDFGTVLINTPKFHTFTVKNDGNATLTLGTPSVIGGLFRLASNSLGPSLAPYTSATFVVEFLSTTVGTFIGQISLGNNDADESDYTFTVLAKADDIEVSVAAPDAEASERETGANVGAFKFTRTGSTANALTVSYTMSGTATNNTDYGNIGGTVVIPAGQPSKTVTLTPIDDHVLEGVETAIATITANSTRYKLGDITTATIDILDNENLPPEFLTGDDTDPNVRNTDKFYFYMGANQFSNSSFQRYLTAEDPEGDVITWSISDSSGNFTIDLTTGLLKLKNTAVIDLNETYTFNATVTSFGGTDTAVVTVYIMPSISLKTIDFTTDHDLLRKPNASNPTFALNGDGRYHDIEWKASPNGYADPLTHTMNTKVTLDVLLTGVPAGISFELVGDAPGVTNDLDFRKSGARGNSVTVTAEDPLRANVHRVDKVITWSILIDGQTVQLEDSRNLIYVTYGAPPEDINNIVTQTRMEWLTDVADGMSDPEEIVAAIHAASGNLDNFRLAPPDSQNGWGFPVWKFLDHTDENPVYAECIDHVELIQAGVAMLGIPNGQIGFVYPVQDITIKGQYYTDNFLPGEGATREGRPVLLRYFAGGFNKYEAVYLFSDTYYGGFSGIYADEHNDPNDPARVTKRKEMVLMESVAGGAGQLRWVYFNGSRIIQVGDGFTW